MRWITTNELDRFLVPGLRNERCAFCGKELENIFGAEAMGMLYLKIKVLRVCHFENFYFCVEHSVGPDHITETLKKIRGKQ